MIIWGFTVALDLWLAGMAAGAYMAAFLAERFGRHTDQRLLHTAIYLGIPAALGGVTFLLMDLSYPLRFWHLFLSFNPTSPMSIGGWTLVLWMTTSTLIILLWNLRRWIPVRAAILDQIRSFLHWIGFGASVFLMTYTGVLLSSSNQPMWSSTILLTPLFVVSAVSSGAAILIIVSMITGVWKVYGETIMRMVQVVAGIIVVELFVLLTYLLRLSQSLVSGASASMSHLTTGVLAIPFWLGVVLLAILIPFSLYVIHWGKRIEEHRIVLVSSIASSACVVFGGLILRTVIVIGGQI